MKKYLSALLLLAVLAAAGYILFAPKRLRPAKPARPKRGSTRPARQSYPHQLLVSLLPRLHNQNAQTHRLLFTVLYDTQGHTQQAYQVIAAPTSFLVDKNGHIAKTYVGEPDFAEVYRLADQLLAE
ncbi:hypothetical protein A7P98_08080 [Eikenella sp. NML080894]|uniref:peroxiredoxin family protein n=1 Tax=Eikenella TaxID=538 RepID=UPI0007E19EDB|nr:MULTISPECIES: redoxin domain-containing protein [Eikenella]OAM35490.1 hypothetical protein A7P98_08080 [Eikenella sp. NML080894]